MVYGGFFIRDSIGKARLPGDEQLGQLTHILNLQGQEAPRHAGSNEAITVTGTERQPRVNQITESGKKEKDLTTVKECQVPAGLLGARLKMLEQDDFETQKIIVVSTVH